MWVCWGMIGELMGENWAYLLWLYPRIHVQPCDHQRSHPIGQWSNHRVFPLATSNLQQSHNYTAHIHQHYPYLSVPISSWHNNTEALIILGWTIIFGYDSHSLWFLVYHIHHAQPSLFGFILSLRLCAPLSHSFTNSSFDVSLFTSLTDSLAFVLCWFIHSHNPLWFQFLYKSFSHSLSPFVLLSFPNTEDIPF